MCGFTGYVQRRHGGVNAEVISDMRDALTHRGPDDAGIWLDEANGVAFGHRRLAILDLSPAGYQPMHSSCKRYVIVFNGEIYNHQELRRRLSSENGAPTWRGHSDTETLLACISSWGLGEALEALKGMFAFALWDREQRVLTLARDRLGEKPLYYGQQGSAFLFGSELKSLTRHPEFEGKVSRSALGLFLRLSYVPGPYSIYQGISKLEPGCYLSYSEEPGETRIHRYWSGIATACNGAKLGFQGSPQEAVSEVERLIRASVERQMVADVSVGAFLSGGIDSSTVAALMQAQSSRPIKTFTIGSSRAGYNEALHARAVAQHLGTEHSELYVEPQQALDVIPKLPSLYDEPFADSSQIPTFLVSALARQKVTVALSGDGGDELFGGYNRHAFTARFWPRLSRVPKPVRASASKLLMALSPAQWDSLSSLAGFARIPMPVNLGDKMHKSAGVLASRSVQDLYQGLISSYAQSMPLVIGGEELPIPALAAAESVAGLAEVDRIMALDLVSYLPDDVLAKVDRAAMGASLETRVPLLDHELVEFAWRLPLSLKLHNNQSKWVLRQVLYRYVPAELVERPKMGFAIPLGEWLRGPLQEWAEELLSERRLNSEGFLNPTLVRSIWKEHLYGKADHARLLWNCLMFQAWHEAWCL